MAEVAYPRIAEVAELAERLLAPLGSRWRHVQAVAARAQEVAPAVAPEEQELLVLAAWLHDVGYARELVVTGLHPLDGARYLASLGYRARLVNLVAHHSGARFEAEERGLADELAAYPREDSPVMDALVCADMTVGPRGQRLSFDERIEEILHRYKPTSPVHRAINRARPVLAESVRRTEVRLDLPDVRRAAAL